MDACVSVCMQLPEESATALTLRRSRDSIGWAASSVGLGEPSAAPPRAGPEAVHRTCMGLAYACSSHANTMQIPCKYRIFMYLHHANTMQVPCICTCISLKSLHEFFASCLHMQVHRVSYTIQVLRSPQVHNSDTCNTCKYMLGEIQSLLVVWIHLLAALGVIWF